MLSAGHRFRGSGEINAVRREGKSYDGRYFVARYCGGAAGNSLFAVVVSAKISKKATRRNKIKRRIYEVVRMYLSEDSGMVEGWRCVFFVRSMAARATFAEIRADLNQFFHSLSLKK